MEDREYKKAWLHRYINSQQIERNLVLQLEELRSEAERITPLLSLVPGGAGGNGDQLQRAVERIEDTRQELTKTIEQELIARLEIADAINQEHDGQRHEILTRRYLQAQKWEDIAREMHVDDRYVYRLHNRAVKDLQIPHEEASKSQ